MIQRVAEGAFLADLFAEWHRAGYRYVVLRHYETLPETVAGHDLDLLVAPADLEAMFQSTRRVAALHGGHLIAGHRQSGIIARFAGRSTGWWGIAIDFFAELSHRGLPFYDATEVLAHATRWRGVAVAAPDDAVMIGWIKEYLHTGRDRNHELANAARAFVQDTVRWQSMFERFFGTHGASIWTDLLQQGAITEETLTWTVRRLRRCHWRHQWRKHPRRSWVRQWSNLWHRVSRIASPPGFMLAILGTDGSGKSALIDAMRETLNLPLHGAIKVRHWRPGLLPSIVVLTGGRRPEGPVTRPHQAPSSGGFGSLLRLGYYALDFILGYWLIILPELVRQPCLDIFDRYFHDFHVDPRRSRVALPPWVVRIVDGLIPEPDLVICLGTDPERIHARKPELPLPEIARQVSRLRQWQANASHAFWVDSGSTIEKMHDDTLTCLLHAMSQRMDRRFGPIQAPFGIDPRHDERGVSWKVVISVAASGRLLALGLTWGDVVGLARTWSRVDWQRAESDRGDLAPFPDATGTRIRLIEHRDPIDPPYDLIVLGTGWVDLVGLREILGPDGLLVCMRFRGCPMGAGDLQQAGFILEQAIAAIPPRQPRLFFSQQNRLQRQRGLAFHVPGRRWLRGLVSLLRIGVGWGWRVYPGWQGILVAHKPGGSGGGTGVVHWLGEREGGCPDGWVVYAGSDVPRRKLTILASDRAEGRDRVIKLADTPDGAGALQQETMALKLLAGSELAGRIPSVLIEDRWMGHPVMVQTLLSRPSMDQVSRWTGGHQRFLASLARMGAHERPLADTGSWQRLVRGYAAGTNWPEAVRDHFSYLAQDSVLRLPVPCCRTHGDFAPWNLWLVDGRLHVIDWEESEADGLATTDLFYFFYCQLGRRRHFGIGEVWAGFGRILDEPDWRTVAAKEGLGEVIRLWLLERFVRSGEPWALPLLACFVSGGRRPWLNETV